MPTRPPSTWRVAPVMVGGVVAEQEGDGACYFFGAGAALHEAGIDRRFFELFLVGGWVGVGGEVHFGHDPAGGDGVDADAVLGELPGPWSSWWKRWRP